MLIPWGPWAVYPGLWLGDDSPLLEVTPGVANAWGSKGGIAGAQFSYSNVADRPAIVESSLNSRRTLSFDADDYLTSTQPGLMDLYRNVSDAWMFAVFRRETHDAGAAVVRTILSFVHNDDVRTIVGLRITSGPSGNDGLVGFGGRRLYSDSYNEVVSGTVAPATWHIALGRINYTTREIDLRVDGESVASASGAFSGAGLTENSAAIRARVGAYGGTPLAEFLDGSLAAVLCGNTQLSNEDCEKLEGWAAHRYGLTSNLPLGHPYKTDEPTFDLTTYFLHPGTVSNGGHALGFEATRLVSSTRARPNFIFDPNARGRIVGTVKRKDDPANVPLSRRVRLYRDRDGMLIAETWSDASGNYQFDYIEEGEAYTALALDHQHFYRAVAADNLTLANGSITLIDD